MIEQQVSSRSRRSHSSRRVWWMALGVVLLALLGIVLYKGIMLGWAGWNTYQSAMQLRALATTSALDNPAVLQDSLDNLAGHYDRLADELEPLFPLLSGLGFVPEYGGLTAASPELIEAGRQAFELLQAGTAIVAPAMADLRAAQPDAPLADILLQTVAATATELPQFGPQLAALRTTLAAVDTTNLPERLAAPMQAAPSLLDLAEAAAQLGPELPALLGMDGPRTYLILVQNNHELRATGGFIAAVGRLTLDRGKLTELDFADSYSVYRTDGKYPPAPEAMRKYMNIPLLVMRDANWSPDFPTAAQVASALYKSDVGIDVSGIVTVDLHAVRRIFDALGQVQVPGFDTPLTGDNIEEQIVRLWERPVDSTADVDAESQQELGEWWTQRKDFIPRLADAVIATIQAGNADYLALGSAFARTLEERSIQVWLDDPEAAAVVKEQGWDGALRPQENSDFVAVVDTNMGYNKADAAIQRSLEYAVRWPHGASQPAQATLTLTYTHTADAEDPGCDLTPRYGNSYADLIGRCYFDYIRVYAPAGSKLVEATGVQTDSVTTQRGEQRTQVFTGYFILPPRGTNRVTFTYTLPDALTPEAYRLLVQRQSGTQPLPVTVSIDGIATTAIVDGAAWEWPAQVAE